MNDVVKDYKKAFMEHDARKKASCRRFFESEWGKLITGGLDADTVEKSIKVQANYALWRKKYGCGSCKNTRCIHRSGEHYTEMEKGDIYCEEILHREKIESILQEEYGSV